MDVQVTHLRVGQEPVDQRFEFPALLHLGVHDPIPMIVGAYRQQSAALLLRDRIDQDPRGDGGAAEEDDVRAGW